MQKPDPQIRKATAHHEAGHAVVAIATGIMRLDGPIECDARRAHVLTTGREDRIQAWTESGGDAGHWSELMAVIAAAGSEAESRYLRQAGGEVNELRLRRTADKDAREVLDLFGPGAWSLYRRKAGELMARPEIWEAVERLAEKLLCCWPDPLPASEAHRLVHAIEPSKPLVKLDIG